MSDAIPQPVLRVVDLCFRYRGGGGRKAKTIQDVSFDLFPGDTLGVIGSNGAGKSTLLRLLTGVMNPTSGLVIKAPGVRCGLLSLGVGFMVDLTGADNVVISLMLQGFTKKSARALLPEIQEFSELGDVFHERVKTYSAGMRSRLTFSAALHAHSEILLIDEVLSVGDVSFRNKARTALTERINSEQTVVYVSHSEATVKDLCNRTLWIEQGRVEGLGATANVLEAYAQFQKK
ncbi:ABC transporter ATP-binding protein [Luminiphilus sp.]|nr:ABC transporter ATP-binding protein [Luminiphilus sp.]MDA9711258.1 ABC transporter ATP-binding protein [Luminiphilus sp.]